MKKQQAFGILSIATGISLYMIGRKLNELGFVDWTTVFICATGTLLVVYGLFEILKKSKYINK